MTTFRDLFPEAGRISRRYASGERRKYVNPARLLITIFVLFFALMEIARTIADFGSVPADAQLIPLFIFFPIANVVGRWLPFDLFTEVAIGVLIYVVGLVPVYWTVSIRNFFNSSWPRSVIASYGLGAIGFIAWFSFFILLTPSRIA